MKRTAVAALLALAIAPVAFAATQMEAQTVSGTIIDTACYAADKHGPEEAACTEMCLKMGVPASLLTDAGEVLVLLPPNEGSTDAFESIKGFGSDKVRVTGSVMERDGLKAMSVTAVAAAN